MNPDPTDPSTSEEWAFEIELEHWKAELRELLKTHSATEAAEILEERRRQQRD
jgi:hypothetical protein